MTRVTFLGGPRDGEVVEWQGHEVLVAVPRPVGFRAATAAELPGGASFGVLRYVTRRDDDGRWWYVLTPDLGAKR